MYIVTILLCIRRWSKLVPAPLRRQLCLMSIDICSYIENSLKITARETEYVYLYGNIDALIDKKWLYDIIVLYDDIDAYNKYFNNNNGFIPTLMFTDRIFGPRIFAVVYDTEYKTYDEYFNNQKLTNEQRGRYNDIMRDVNARCINICYEDGIFRDSNYMRYLDIFGNNNSDVAYMERNIVKNSSANQIDNVDYFSINKHASITWIIKYLLYRPHWQFVEYISVSFNIYKYINRYYSIKPDIPYYDEHMNIHETQEAERIIAELDDNTTLFTFDEVNGKTTRTITELFRGEHKYYEIVEN